jgi:biopolymer transport protein ExbD
MNISSGGSNSQDFELNLASIIDCLTVLITFLLASTAFLSIGILDAGVSAAGNTATDAKPPEVNLTLELSKEHAIAVKVSGKSSSSQQVAAKEGHWNMEDLTQKLQAIHQQWPSLTAVTLNADNTIEYKDVVQVMETTRKTIPVVLLGGF